MKEFIHVFTGLKRNFGYCDISKGIKDPATGKIKFDNKDYGWTKRSVTDDDYINHLECKGSMGIQPCDEDDKAVFGSINISKTNNIKITRWKQIKRSFYKSTIL